MNKNQPPSPFHLLYLMFKLFLLMAKALFLPLAEAFIPPFLLIAPYGIVAGAISIVLLMIALILRIKFFLKQLKKPSVFLEVIPSDMTLQSHFSTEQLFTTLHKVTEPSRWIDHVIGNRKPISFELVSTKAEGIRYIIKTSPYNANLIKKDVRSYLPEVEIREIADYLPQSNHDIHNKYWQVIEVKLKNHFAIPLVSQSQLDKHDPIAYITGHMTQLSDEDLISMQLVVTPVYSNTHPKHWDDIGLLRSGIKSGKDISPYLYRSKNLLQKMFKGILFFIPKLMLFIALTPPKIIFYFMTSDERVEMLPFEVFSLTSESKTEQKELSQEEQDHQNKIGKKIKSELYEASVRFLVIGDTSEEVHDRIRGFIGSLAPFGNSYQRFTIKENIFFHWLKKIPYIHAKIASFDYLLFRHRLLSLAGNSIFSVSEVASLYHFPYSTTTKTEGILKNKSLKLPAPTSLKRADGNLDVVFAENTYGGQTTYIGLNEEERRRHVYIIGKTGSGKSTLLYQMISCDIHKNKGVVLLDPHGELAEAAINTILKERTNDFIYFNPDDLKYPIRINLLELTPGLDEDDALREKEFITESVISLFRKVFSDAWSGTGSPHRIEYVLRNAIHTAFTVQDCTLFTVFDLLTNPIFRQKIVEKLTDEHLKNFWKFEFGKAGDYQQVKMISPITARIGRFLFSPSAKRILEKPKSTINFDKILDEGKILICNLSKGKLGEDTSEVLGIMILNKIQLAALKRARVDASQRKDCYLYVDEFQNFATPSFVQMLSEARKYKLNVTMAEQSTSQQNDRTMVHIILANVGTVISFGSANPVDEDLMLRQFAPQVKKGDIANLPAFHFYMKISVLNPEDVFSGETIKVNGEIDRDTCNRLIQASRNNYADTYVKPIEKPSEAKDSNRSNGSTKTPKRSKSIGNGSKKKMIITIAKNGLPDDTVPMPVPTGGDKNI